MESYAELRDCLLLRNVISHLPFPDQLTARLVNKDWENEAYHAFRRNKNCVVKLFTHEEITNFIRVFPEPLPARFYSFATFDVKLMRLPLDQLQRFGRAHGAGMQFLQIHVTVGTGVCGKCISREAAESSFRRANENMHAKVKLFLTNFQNLLKLSVAQDRIYGRHYLLFREPNAIPVAELPQFQNLEQLDASSDSQVIILLLNAIIINCPNLHIGNLALNQHLTNRSAVRELLERFGSVELGKLKIVLNLDTRENRNHVLRELLSSDLKPKYLILEPRSMYEPQAEMVARRNDLISQWIQKLTQSPRMTRLKLISWGPNIPLNLPSEMPYLTELDFGFTKWGCRIYGPPIPHRPAIFQMTPLISPGQVPSLRKLVIGPLGNQLNFDEVFPTVRELVIDGHPELIEQLPSPIPIPTIPTYDWSTKFPNVTKLDMVTGIDALLSPVLTNMLNLTHLKVTFQGFRLNRVRGDIDDFDDMDDNDDDDNDEDNDEANDDDDDDMNDNDDDDYSYQDPYIFCFNDELVTAWWDAITGGIRPMLNKDSTLEMIIPSSLEEHAETVLDRGDGAAVPKLRNLCNLKTLEFVNSPASIVMGVIHLTALKQVPQLDKIEILTSKYDAYEPADACVDVLKSFHGQVEVKRYLVDDGFTYPRPPSR